MLLVCVWVCGCVCVCVRGGGSPVIIQLNYTDLICTLVFQQKNSAKTDWVVISWIACIIGQFHWSEFQVFVCVRVNLLLLVFALFSVLGSTPFHQSHTGSSQHGLSDFPRPVCVCVCSKLQCRGLPTKSEFTNPDNGYNKVPRSQILCNCFLQVGDQPSTFKLTLSCPQRSGYKADGHSNTCHTYGCDWTWWAY